MVPEYVLKGEEKNYPILFTNLGMARMEQETELRVATILRKAALVMGRAQTLGKEIDALDEEEDLTPRETVGLFELMALLFAGLEGFRLKFRTRRDPYTLDEVSDIIDDCGGLRDISPTLGRALTDYWPKLLKTQPSASPKKTRKTPKRRATKRVATHSTKDS